MYLKKISLSESIFAFLLFSLLASLWFFSHYEYNLVLCQADLARYFYPLRHFGSLVVKSGEVPLWNPYILCGTPHLAMLQTVIFYPVAILYYLIPSFDLAFNLYIATHFVLGGVFMFLLMRGWKYSFYASIISGMSFAFGGYLIGLVPMNTSLSTVIWLPLIMLFFTKYLEKREKRTLLTTSLLMAIQFLGGNPDFVFITICILILFLIEAFFRKENFSKRLDLIKGFFLIHLIWISIVAFQLIPFIELVSHSHRSDGSLFSEITRWSLTPLELAGFVIPFIKGNISVPLGYVNPQRWLNSYYLGICPLVFAIFGLAQIRQKKMWIFYFLIILSIILALGKYTPFFYFFYKFIPGFSYIRYPVKYLFVTFFVLSILAGVGIDYFLQMERERVRKFIKTLIALNAILIVGATLFYFYQNELGDYIVEAIAPTLGDIGVEKHRVFYTFLSGSFYLMHILIMLTMTTFLIYAFHRKRLAIKTFFTLIAIMLFCDLSIVNNGLLQACRPGVLTKDPPSIYVLKRDKEPFRVFQDETMWKINRNTYGFSYSKGLFDRRNTLISNSTMTTGLEDIYGYDSVVRGDIIKFVKSVRLLPRAKQLKLFGLLNGKYEIKATQEKEDLVFSGPLSGGTVIHEGAFYDKFYIYKNPYALERVYYAPYAMWVASREDQLKAIMTDDFNPKETVVLLTDGSHQAYSQDEPSRQKEKINKTEPQIVKNEAHHIVIEADCDTPQWLILADTYFPGWQAEINGKEAKIFRANYLLRALWLDEGKHTIQMRYKPASYKWGQIISFVFFLIILLTCIKSTLYRK